MPVVAPDNPVPDIKWWHTATVYQVYKKLYGNRSSRPPAWRMCAASSMMWSS